MDTKEKQISKEVPYCLECGYHKNDHIPDQHWCKKFVGVKPCK